MQSSRYDVTAFAQALVDLLDDPCLDVEDIQHARRRTAEYDDCEHDDDQHSAQLEAPGPAGAHPQRGNRVAVDLCDDGRRRFLGCEQPEPHARFHAWITCFHDARDIGSGLEALLAQHREGLDAA